MASIKKDIRTNQSLAVIQRSNQGISIVKACEEVGISRSTFYYFISHNPDAIATFQEMQRESEMAQFMLILDNQFGVLEKVLQDALAGTTTSRQRLAILKYLDKRMDVLSERTIGHLSKGNEAADFLTGPKLEPGVSSFQSTEILIPDIDVKEG